MKQKQEAKEFPISQGSSFLSLQMASHTSVCWSNKLWVRRLKPSCIAADWIQVAFTGLCQAPRAGSDRSKGTHAHSCTAAQTKQATLGSGSGLPAWVFHRMSPYPSANILDRQRDRERRTLRLNQALSDTESSKLLEILKWIWNLFSVALVLLISG